MHVLRSAASARHADAAIHRRLRVLAPECRDLKDDAAITLLSRAIEGLACDTPEGRVRRRALVLTVESRRRIRMRDYRPKWRLQSPDAPAVRKVSLLRDPDRRSARETHRSVSNG